MAVVILSNPPRLDLDEVRSLGSGAGLTIPEKHIDDFALLLGALDKCVEDVHEMQDYTLTPDLARYPRTHVHIPGPNDNDKGGWATKCIAKSTSPKSTLLAGKTVALKDNIALAGVRCTNGTEAVDWIPSIDATIATRIMDAGATINGKAACESGCLEGDSDTSCTGKVHNPFADNYSCGGSSSGSGRVVASGEADMSIGCDQGGSIRIPASMCGLVGLKPTWGLVPYTGILSLDCTIDHAGPMARTVSDAALLLEAIAGPDGIDDRQPYWLSPGTLLYSSNLTDFLATTASSPIPLAGIRIGILAEGFSLPTMNPHISRACTSAISTLIALGAEAIPISIPSHLEAGVISMLNVPMGGGRQCLLNELTGRKQLYLTDRMAARSSSTSGDGGKQQLSQAAFDALGPGAQLLWMRHLYLSAKHGAQLHAKCANLLRKLSDDYDRALARVDVLVMPTLPVPPGRLFEDPAALGPLERLSRNVGLGANVAPFNSSGHPALTLPVGFVPAQEDEGILLPTGLQIVGRKFEDGVCLKIGAAWERAVDWRSVKYGAGGNE